MRLRTYRRTSQVIFAVLTLTGVIVGTTGIVYPYFFCYSCPWDVGACPIGILEHSFVDMALPNVALITGIALLLFLLGFLFLMGALFGRAFCGWACPMGVLQDLTIKFGISKKVGKKLGPKEIDDRLKYIKYLILISIPILSYYSLSLFYTTFCPVGGITGTVPTLLVYGNDWLFGTTFPLKVVSVALFSILIILVGRGWCKYLCPVGAMLAPWNKISAVKLKRDRETCNDCGLCELKCPMNVKDIGIKDDMECILCGRCVTSCRKNSLKLGYRFAGAGTKALVMLLPLILISSAMMATGIWKGGYERTEAINDIPCLGCLALDPKSPEGWFAVDDLPDFIMEELADKPVIIDYRTTVCAACDEMDPHVEALKDEYGDDVFFFKHNKDDPTQSNFDNLDEYPTDSDEYQSYFIFDVKGNGVDLTGVPLFPIITYRPDGNGTVGIFFRVFYGSSADGGVTQMANIAVALDEAIELYDQYGGGQTYYSGEQTPFVELLVAMNCVNCPDAEDALLDLMEEDNYVNFASFVADALEDSGDVARERENYYSSIFGKTIARPWAIFGGGADEEQGATTKEAITQIYRNMINATILEPLNVSITGEITDNANALNINLAVAHDDTATQSLRIQIYVLEVNSRWPNHYTHLPIPYAVVDIPLNTTYNIDAGTSEDILLNWTGTNDLTYADFRLSNLATMIVVWKGNTQVTSKLIKSGIPEYLWMTSTEPVQSALPNNTANYSVTLHNDRNTEMTVKLTIASVPDTISVNISKEQVTIPANGQVDVTLMVIGTNTVVGDQLSFIFHVEDVTDPTLSTGTTLVMETKNDITPPVIVNVAHTPSTVNADQEIQISATVGDNVGIKSVDLYYYSCDDLSCSPTDVVQMILESGKYVSEEAITPVELNHNIFHYWIVAEDTSGNLAVTYEYNITVTPVETHEDGHDGHAGGSSPFNTYGIGLVIVFAMVAIGLNIARVAGKGHKKAESKKSEPPKEEHTEESEENPSGELSTE